MISYTLMLMILDTSFHKDKRHISATHSLHNMCLNDITGMM